MPRTTDAAVKLEQAFQAIRDVVANAKESGRAEALATIQGLIEGRNRDMAKRGPGRPKGSKNKPKGVTKSGKSGKKRKNSWAGLSPAEKLARVNAIRKGRGLPPKTA